MTAGDAHSDGYPKAKSDTPAEHCAIRATLFRSIHKCGLSLCALPGDLGTAIDMT